MMHTLRRHLAGWGIALWVGCLATAGAAEPFQVGPGDRIAVTVYRRPDLSGEFRVLPGGAVSLPFIGNIPIAGRSVDEFREALVQRLRDEVSLQDPRVSVEIAEFQPVLVAGDVRRPGQAPFTPGMTVGHAVASAGGMRRFNLEEIGGRMEIMRLRERLRQTQESFGMALIRQARLRAEGRELKEFDTPPEAARYLSAARVRELREAELQIMQHREAAYTSTLALLTNQTVAYTDEIQALQEQSETKNREQRLIEQEQEYVANLMRQGLTARDARVVQLARAAVQLDGDRRQIAAFTARARQEIARIEQTRTNTRIQRQLEIANGLKEVEDSLAGMQLTLEETRAGLTELRETLPGDDRPIGPPSATVYSIMRVRGGPAQRLTAEIDTPLQPGDLLEVSTDPTGPTRRFADGARN